MKNFQNIKLSKSEFKDCWQLIKPWWVSEEKWVARGLFTLVFLLDMSIVGITRDGKRVQIFKDGNWAFEI